MNRRETFALSVAGIYIFIMGIGMFTMHHIFTYSYGEPEMMYVLFFFEIIMSIVAYVGYKRLGLSSLSEKPQFSLWSIPYICIFVLNILFCLFTGDFSKDPNLVITILFTTILVGFSEELVFRGIVLPIFIEKKKVLPALLISSLAFSLLHAVNILGGTTLLGTLTQLFLTFIFGLVFSCMALQVRNIIPLMIFHFSWDFVLISHPITSANTTLITTIGSLLNFVIVIPIVMYTVKNVPTIIRK